MTLWEMAEMAEEHLRRVPHKRLGPAGRLLVDNPREMTPQYRRSLLRVIHGEGSMNVSSGQTTSVAGSR